MSSNGHGFLVINMFFEQQQNCVFPSIFQITSAASGHYQRVACICDLNALCDQAFTSPSLQPIKEKYKHVSYQCQTLAQKPMATDENKIAKAEWHGFLFLPPEGKPILSSNGFKVFNNQASTKRREPNLRLRVPYPGNLSEIQFVHTGCVGSVSQNESKTTKELVDPKRDTRQKQQQPMGNR